MFLQRYIADCPELEAAEVEVVYITRLGEAAPALGRYTRAGEVAS